MNKDLRNTIKSYVAEYLMYHFPQLKIKKTNLFSCPFKHEHEYNNGKDSCKIYPQFGYKVKCYHCGELGNIFDIFRRLEPDMKNFTEKQIADYLIHLLDIKLNEQIDTLLEKYYNSGFYLIPLQPNSKNPVQGESWKKNITNDIKQWKEWVEAGLGLGLVCGKVSKVITIDIDTKEIPKEIKDIMNGTLIQETKKGWHILYEYDECFDYVNHQNFRRKGYEIDFRANNSYIVVAPTIVDDYTRTWNDKKICKIPDKLKKFLLELIDKDKSENKNNDEDEIQKAIDEENIELKGLIQEGSRDDELTKIGGIFRKQMNLPQVLSVLLFINKNFCKPPLSFNQVKKIAYSLNKYDTYDKKNLAKEILTHLKLESVRFANTSEISKSLGYTKKEIEDVLDYLVREQKVQKIGKQFKALNKIEWVDDFMDRGKPLEFTIPYFDKYARFRNGALIVIGGKSGKGKTTLSCNFIKQFVDQGIKPYYISTEAGSNFDIISASLGLKEGDFYLPPKNKFIDPFSIELEDNAVTIIDWLRPTDSDYAKTDTLYEKINNQLTLHGGCVIAFAQMKNETEMYAEQMIHAYASLVGKYYWSKHVNSKTKEITYDAENTYFRTEKIRDSKSGLQYINIPTFFNKETKLITLRSGE